MSSGDLEPRVVALGGDLERLTQRMDRGEALLRILSQQVAELHAAVHPAEPEPPEVRSWLLAADDRQARDDLADLFQWLADVYLRYPDAVLPSCWLWHPTVVEELWWLRNAHHEAYIGPHATYTRAADWHDRQRLGVVRRIRAAIGDCELLVHERSRTAPVVPLVGSADQIANTWVSSRTVPVPTTEQLGEADHHERQANHR